MKKKLKDWIRRMEDIDDEISVMCNAEKDHVLGSLISHLGDYIPEMTARMKSILEREERDGLFYKGSYTGEVDRNGNKIYYETTILRSPDGRLCRLRFDNGELAAYFARLDGSCIVELEGVNNVNSFYLRDCEVVFSLRNECRRGVY